MPAFKPIVPQFSRPQSTMRVPAPVFQSEPLTAFDAVGADVPTLLAEPVPTPQAEHRKIAAEARSGPGGGAPFGGLFGGQNPFGNLRSGFGGLGNQPMFPTPEHASLLNFQVPSDLFSGPYVETGAQLDGYGRMTPQQRWACVQLFIAIPELRAAINSLAGAIASAAAEATIQPASWGEADRHAGALCKHAYKKCRGGPEGLARAIVIGALIQGASAVELRMRPDYVPGMDGVWSGVKWAYRGLDLTWLGLELDPYRDTMGVVSLRRGIETFAADQVMWYTHDELFANPFGHSVVFPLIDACNAILACMRLWQIALEMYATGYAKGKVKNPSEKQMMADTLQQLRSLGFGVIGAEDDIELLSLQGATGWQAFESFFNKQRERIFQGVRYAYTPFIEGTGEKDSTGKTSVHESASDVSVDFPAKAVARLIREHGFARVVEWNCPPQNGRPVGVPELTLGAIDPEETNKFMTMVKTVTETGIEVSADAVRERIALPPPKNEQDRFMTPEMKEKEEQKKQGQQPGQPQPGPDGKPALPATGTPQPTPAPSQQSPATPATPPGTIPPAPEWFKSMVDQAIAVPLGA